MPRTIIPPSPSPPPRPFWRTGGKRINSTIATKNTPPPPPELMPVTPPSSDNSSSPSHSPARLSLASPARDRLGIRSLQSQTSHLSKHDCYDEIDCDYDYDDVEEENRNKNKPATKKKVSAGTRKKNNSGSHGDASILRGAALVRKNLKIFNRGSIDPPATASELIGSPRASPSRTSSSSSYQYRSPSRSSSSSSYQFRAPQKSLLDDALEEEDNDTFADLWSEKEWKEQQLQQEEKSRRAAKVTSAGRYGNKNKNNSNTKDISPAPSFDEEIHYEAIEFANNLDRDTGYNAKPKKNGQESDTSHLSFGSNRTPETLMGRNKSLKCKMYTYHVQPTDEMGDSSFEDSGESFIGSYEGTVFPPKPLPVPLPMPVIAREEKHTAIEDPLPSLLSPLTREYGKLMQDPGYIHAQKAGYLWQSLVGQHVRFPKHWFDSLRSPPMGGNASWKYVARHTIDNNPIFANLIRNRSAPGRLLLHLVVRDILKGTPVLDIAVGVFHPNSRGVRATERPDPRDEEARHVWMAIRKRSANHVTVLDSLLLPSSSSFKVNRSPIGENRRTVTNANMRAVFGEQPPLQTISILESELWEKLTVAAQMKPEAAHAPALLLLQEFLVLH